MKEKCSVIKKFKGLLSMVLALAMVITFMPMPDMTVYADDTVTELSFFTESKTGTTWNEGMTVYGSVTWDDSLKAAKFDGGKYTSAYVNLTGSPLKEINASTTTGFTISFDAIIDSNCTEWGRLFDFGKDSKHYFFINGGYTNYNYYNTGQGVLEICYAYGYYENNESYSAPNNDLSSSSFNALKKEITDDQFDHYDFVVAPGGNTTLWVNGKAVTWLYSDNRVKSLLGEISNFQNYYIGRSSINASDGSFKGYIKNLTFTPDSSIGTQNPNKTTATDSDFSFNSSTGEVSAADGKSLGTITNYYKKSGTTTWSSTKPTEEGTYAVGVVTTGSDTYNIIGTAESPFTDSSWSYTVSNSTPTVSSIIMKSNPTKTSYKVGDTLELTGAKITVTLSDATTEEIAVTSEMISGYDGSKTGDQTITVTYEGKTTTFTINVVPTHSHGEGTLVLGKAATCTEVGYKAFYQCSCGKYYEDKACTKEITDLAAWKTGDGKIAAKGHDFSGEWTVTKKATTTTDGKKEISCKNGCGTKKVDSIPAIGAVEEDSSNGNLNKDVQVASDAPVLSASLDNSKTELMDASGILTVAEKEQIKNGQNASIYLQIAKLDRADIATEDQSKLETAAVGELGETKTIEYMDVSLFKKIGSSEAENVHTPGTDIDVTLEIPNSMLVDQKGMVRKYRVLRLHDGVVEVIKGTFNYETNEFSFATDRFSTYAIAYSDEKEEIEINLPGGDGGGGTTISEPGGTIQLDVKVTPEDDANQTVKFTSSNEKVATVSDTGLITAVGEGSAEITVTTVDGAVNKSITITVAYSGAYRVSPPKTGQTSESTGSSSPFGNSNAGTSQMIDCLLPEELKYSEDDSEA